MHSNIMCKLWTLIELLHYIGGDLFIYAKSSRYNLMEYKRRESVTSPSPQSLTVNPHLNPSATEMKKAAAYSQENMLSCPVRSDNGSLVCCAGRALIRRTSARGTLTRLTPRIDSESTLMKRSLALRHPQPGSQRWPIAETAAPLIDPWEALTSCSIV